MVHKSRLYPEPNYVRFPYQRKKNKPILQVEHPLPVSTLVKGWHRFRYIIYPEIAILHGTICQTSKRFRPRTNGRQDSANCTVAVIFANIFKMSDWNSKYIDKILIIGDELLTLSITFKPQLRYEMARPKDLYNNVYIDNVKITYTTDGPTLCGKLYPESGCSDLKTALEEYLDKHETALCAVLTLLVAFWRKDGLYYYFDPHERDENGIAVRFQGGKACVMRFLDIEQMVDAFCANVDRNKNFHFTLLPINILRITKVRIDPPLVPMRVPLNMLHDEPITPQKPEPIKPIKVPPVEPLQTVIDVYEMNPNFVKNSPNVTKEQKDYVDKVISETHLAPLSIEIKPHIIPSVTNFHPTSSNTGILRGNTHKRPDLSPSITLYSLGMLKVYKSRYWTKDIINNILHYGHKLYKQSFYKQGSGGDRHVELKDVIKDIVIMSKKFTADVNHSSVIGVLNSAQKNVVDLATGLADFFREYDNGIIQGPITVAVWQEDDLYYMFDPCERDENGCILQSTNSCTEQLPEGKACVTWFKLLDDLNKLYCWNVPKEKRFDPFFISNVIFTDYVEVPMPWCNFIGIKPGKWIMRGSFSQNSSRFADDNRNCQCTANAAIAITFRLLYLMEDWNTDIIDNILLEGDEFYSTTVQQLKDTEKFKHPHLMLDELLRSYTLLSISGKHSGKRINFDLRECLVNGIITARDDDQSMNLTKGVIEFFKEYDCGVVTAGNISVAIWKYNDHYYYFDSHTRDHKGIIHGLGTACVLRLESVDELVKSIETNLQPVPKDLFNIGYCEATIWETDESGVVKPPLNNYTRINDTSAILRATHHEGDKLIYYENSNKQTFSNCLVATAMMKMMPSSLWTVTIMDEILKFGNKLHERAYLKVLEKDPTFEDNLTFEDCEKAFRLGDYFVTIKPEEAIKDKFESKSENLVYNTFLSYFRKQDNPQQPDLHKCAIFSSTFVTVACWVDLGVMYIFDPKEMDSQGFSLEKDLWSERHIDLVLYSEFDGEGHEFAHQTSDEPSNLTEDEIEEKKGEDSEDSNDSDDTTLTPPVREQLPGKAYCRWFTTLGTFAQHIVDNTPPNQLTDTEFTLIPLTVDIKVIGKEKPVPPEGAVVQPPEDANPAYVGPWYNFMEIVYGCWIIRGTYCESDLRFSEMTRGNQDAAMAIAFFIFKHSIDLREWKSSLVDAVLKYGDKLHTYCLQKIKKNMALEYLDCDALNSALSKVVFEPNEMFKEFCLGEHLYKLILTEKLVVGDINSTEKDSTKPDEAPVLNLLQALTEVTANYKNCIIYAKNKSFAVYKGQEMYYLFDPNCRGPNGLNTTVGVACLLRFMSLEKLVEMIKLNLPEIGNNRFYIDGVDIEKEMIQRGTELGKTKIPEPTTEPTAFTSVELGKIIISGTISQEDKRFNRGKNIQSAACSLVALAMSFIHRTDVWSKEIVDEVVINGDRLHGTSVDNLGFNFNPWEETMSVQKCDKEFYIGINHVVCEIIENSDECGMQCLAKLAHEVKKLFNSDNTHGVIQSSVFTVATWKDDNYYYIFDPYPRNAIGNTFSTGTACIMGFYSPQVMAKHCLSNIPIENHQDDCMVIPIAVHLIKSRNKFTKQIYPTPILDKQLTDHEGPSKTVKKREKPKKSKKLPKHWMSTKDTNTSILYAGFSQISKVFSDFSRGYQSSANAIVSIVMFHLNEPSSWTQDSLNSILMSGDQLYKDSYLRYRPKDREVGLNMLLRRFYVEKYRVEVVIYKPSIIGDLTEMDISNGVHNFFLQERAGVFIALGLIIAIFQKGGQYYIFDPHGCDLSGNVVNNGRAVLLRFKNFDDVSIKLSTKLTLSENTNSDSRYCLHAIQIKDIVYVP